MRLHHLEITAFGPFAETASVDFDALSDAGLFLLSGATGAGKTSVLDAVCFALYGEVPGDRQSAKRLRSDQAVPGVTPLVTLELSLGGRRFRVVRSPAWQRPKKRGTGTTTEQASVRFSERIDDSWTMLSTRLDETGHLVTHLVGMNLTQFCQVAMLPQGRFQAFLRARSDERHQLLQQLFRTTRFEQVERWLRDRRRTLRQASAHHHEVVADLVSRISETAAVPLPQAWDPHDLTLPATEGDLERWSATHRSRAASRAGEASSRAGQVTLAEHATRHTLEQARKLAELQATHRAAVSERDILVSTADEHCAQVEAIADARRADAVLPLHRVAQEAALEAVAAERRSTALGLAVAPHLGTPDVIPSRGQLEDSLARARDDAARARVLLPREAALDALRHQLADSAREVITLTQRSVLTRERLDALPALVAAARAAFGEALQAEQALAGVRVEVATLRARQQAAALLLTLETELAQAQALHSAAIDAAQQHKEIWLHLQEERISGMAAEIAGALAVGADCPVCGSFDHPHPAPPRPGAPDAAAEKDARRLVDDAEVARHAHDVQVRDLTTRLDLAREQAGADREGLSHAIAEADTRLCDLELAAASGPDHRAALAQLESEHEQTSVTHQQDAVALAALQASGEARRSEAEAIAAELAALLEGSGAATTADLLVRHELLADECEAALQAATALDHARATQRAAALRAESAAVDAGFAGLEAALDASLALDSVTAMSEAVRVHEAALARVTALLADPELRAAGSVTAPDLERLVLDHQTTEAELADARTAAAVTESRARRLTALDDELLASLAAWAPVRDDLALTAQLAALTDGTSPDNRLQMRLSGYVLAWRLTQVVAAANERLGRMSDQRYSLEHTGRKGAGETRGGLSLLVRDDWSGETRDPATLSGGETFVVSLALALGLADVIAHEVGGTDLDTLFVDEGFGSLDADTLDDVMDTLDSLRDGGRVVGVVSHVAEMRDRIPAQLQVTKSRTGSTLSVSR